MIVNTTTHPKTNNLIKVIVQLLVHKETFDVIRSKTPWELRIVIFFLVFFYKFIMISWFEL
jgi:hypothetical protein